MWSHRGRFVQYATSEQRAHGCVMRFCSWQLSFSFSSWAWEAFAGRSLQRTPVHASCSRSPRRGSILGNVLSNWPFNCFL